MNKSPNSQNDIDLRAAHWATKSLDPAISENEIAQRDVWLNASEQHQAAYSFAVRALSLMEVTGKEMNHYRLQNQNQLAGHFSPSNDEQATSEQSSPNNMARPWFRRSGITRIWSVAACLMVALLAAKIWVGNPEIFFTADYRTAPGEVRSFTLSDGSVATLGPESAIKVDFNTSERRIQLLAGIADFKATPKQQAGGRNFVIDARDGEATALGTRFVVDAFDPKVKVSVLEHVVRVSLKNDQPELESIKVPEGQEVTYLDGHISSLHPFDPTYILNWQQGRMVFDSVPLSSVIKTLSHYQYGKILIANEATANRLVSGVFNLQNPAKVVDVIAKELDIKKVSATPLLTVLY